MKLLTKDSDYAIRALLYLAGNGKERVSSADIAKHENVPYPFMRRIIHAMARKGLVETREGAKGGVVLGKKAGSIRIIDVIELFQGTLQFSECLFQKKICVNRSNCVLRHRIQSVERKVVKEFRSITIQTLLNDLTKISH